MPAETRKRRFSIHMATGRPYEWVARSAGRSIESTAPWRPRNWTVLVKIHQTNAQCGRGLLNSPFTGGIKSFFFHFFRRTRHYSSSLGGGCAAPNRFSHPRLSALVTNYSDRALTTFREYISMFFFVKKTTYSWRHDFQFLFLKNASKFDLS